MEKVKLLMEIRRLQQQMHQQEVNSLGVFTFAVDKHIVPGLLNHKLYSYKLSSSLHWMQVALEAKDDQLQQKDDHLQQKDDQLQRQATELRERTLQLNRQQRELQTLRVRK